MTRAQASEAVVPCVRWRMQDNAWARGTQHLRDILESTRETGGHRRLIVSAEANAARRLGRLSFRFSLVPSSPPGSRRHILVVLRRGGGGEGG